MFCVVAIVISLLTEQAILESYPTARLTNEEPEFEGEIGNSTYPLGREAVLSCTVSNLGKYKVGWLKEEDQTILTIHHRVVTHSSRVSITHDGLNTWQLHIRPLRETDRGCYMCQINTSSMKKQLGCIDVTVPPDIINDETIADNSVQEFDNTSLSCKASGHPLPRVIWKREDGEPILLKKPGTKDFHYVEYHNGSVMYLYKVDRRQMGKYLCIASNDVPPAVSKRITLNVNFAPNVNVPNQLLGAPLDTDVELECSVEAFPNTINYWIKNRGEMLLDGAKYSVKEEKISYRVVMWMKIKNFSRSDVGTYNCVSTNSLGKSEGTLRLYEIKTLPSVEQELRNNYIDRVYDAHEVRNEPNSGKDIYDNGANNVLKIKYAHAIAFIFIIIVTVFE